MARYGLIVFDWDGTLVDSMARIVGAMRATMVDLALPERTDAELRAGIGLGFDEVVDRLFPGLSRAERAHVRSTFRDYFLEGGQSAQLFPGAHDALSKLAGAGSTLAVATGKGRAGLDQELLETGLGGLMVATRCVDECASKPAPDMLLQLMDYSGHGRAETLMVGDSEYDLLMARNAGTASVGVGGGAHTRDALLRHAPIAVIGSVAELPTLLATGR
ncbi:MAG: HAD-IA family hydrolase [Gammaproteobacteria bacterium]